MALGLTHAAVEHSPEVSAKAFGPIDVDGVHGLRKRATPGIRDLDMIGRSWQAVRNGLYESLCDRSAICLADSRTGVEVHGDVERRKASRRE
jgi:hypothetical protein